MAQILQAKGYTRVRALLGGWNAWLEARGAVEEAGMTRPPETQETPGAVPPNSSGDLKGNSPADGAAPKAQTAPAKKTTRGRTKRRRART